MAADMVSESPNWPSPRSKSRGHFRGHVTPLYVCDCRRQQSKGGVCGDAATYSVAQVHSMRRCTLDHHNPNLLQARVLKYLSPQYYLVREVRENSGQEDKLLH
ncbi:hypothetical protein VC83_07019 [Pseudogymnoascus destructans]|uniref:Uncharacterized protein n=1 Tax=Pseudogymnoascus destructans TaxID=655981 RepID=A0A177A3M0_9PEZI|nr:uncharacterized protein VC83_07019 [Pseudogymnoascus destructans]OAF56889.1 hypothetical protein VC83_07019 [Pseudogymnoascus destructans]